MRKLIVAIAYEVEYQRLRSRSGYITRAWCMGSVAFLVGVHDKIEKGATT